MIILQISKNKKKHMINLTDLLNIVHIIHIKNLQITSPMLDFIKINSQLIYILKD